MPDAARRRICEVLRRDEALITREAARSFVQQLHLQRGTPQTQEEAAKADEAEAILADSFKRLAGVVALSLQVEEARLVSEELQWLERQLGARFDSLAGATFLDLLAGSFSGACRRSLSSDDCAIIAGLFADARAGLAEVEPLLTETRTLPHFEGSTAQYN